MSKMKAEKRMNVCNDNKNETYIFFSKNTSKEAINSNLILTPQR